MAANLEEIRKAFCEGTYFFTHTGFPKMLKRGIKEEEVVEALCHDAPEIIEDYPGDARGPACLILGWADLARPLHVEVGYGPTSETAIDVITVYEPDSAQWYNPRVRRR